MISFENDYNAGAHPKILERLLETNLEKHTGYGEDIYTKRAIEKIKTAIDCPDAEVYLAVGGTQTNQLVISTMLQGYEGVIAADTGHVSVHEAGAIEYAGAKVLTIPHELGKINAGQIEMYVKGFYQDGNHEHMVFPGMVYISHPTEYGTLYTLEELEEIAKVCNAYDMSLFLDGARLGYGLASKDTDVTIKDIARLADVFYIGGTKVGALCGEAIVFTKKNQPKHFVNLAKKRGALLAKGRLLGVQFDTLFTDGLYEGIGRHAIDKAERLKSILKDNGFRFLIDSPTNQQYVVVEDSFMKKLSEKVVFSFWEKIDESHTAIRFVTSWATTDEDLDELERILKEM